MGDSSLMLRNAVHHRPAVPAGRDEESGKRKRLSPRETNVGFKCAAPKCKADYRKQEFLHMVTLRDKKIAEKLLVNDVVKCSFL